MRSCRILPARRRPCCAGDHPPTSPADPWPLQILFATMALNLSADDPPILGVGVVLSFVVEVKKTLRKFTWRG